MKRLKWESSQKLKIVQEGLSGQIEIRKLCNKYQVSQVIYYHWIEQLLQYGQKAFESKNITKRKHCLQSENQRLKQIIGDLSIPSGDTADAWPTSIIRRVSQSRGNVSTG